VSLSKPCGVRQASAAAEQSTRGLCVCPTRQNNTRTDAITEYGLSFKFTGHRKKYTVHSPHSMATLLFWRQISPISVARPRTYGRHVFYVLWTRLCGTHDLLCPKKMNHKDETTRSKYMASRACKEAVRLIDDLKIARNARAQTRRTEAFASSRNSRVMQSRAPATRMT
jgi:hypothetical protein